jgi:repressor LexA
MVLTKRQKEILDFLRDYTARHGYAPTLSEIGRRFELSSLATVHKHLKNLADKRFIRRKWNRSRAVEIVNPAPGKSSVVELPLLGTVAAGAPIEPVEMKDTLAVPAELARGENCFVLRVKGDSMIDEQIRDGDLIVVQSQPTAENGETAVVLVNGEATVKRFFREEGGMIRLQPANERLEALRLPAGQLEVRGVVVAVIRKY